MPEQMPEPTLADLAAHPHIAFLWDDNPTRDSTGVTVRAALAAGVRPQDLAVFKRVASPHASDETAAAMLLNYLGTLVDAFPDLTVRDASAWAMVAEQAWATTLGSVTAFTQAGLGPDAWWYLAAGLTPDEAVQTLADHGGVMPVETLAVMAGLRGTVLPDE